MLVPAAAPGQLSYVCGGEIKVVVPESVYTAVQGSASCVPSDNGGRCLVNGYNVDFDLYAAIKSGTCSQVCLLIYYCLKGASLPARVQQRY